MPKLKTRFYRFQTALARAEDEIKRSRFTASVSTLKQALKRQYTSTFVINKSFQTVGISAETDGLNSMLKEIRALYQLPNTAISYGPTNAAVTIPVTNLFGSKLRAVNTTTDIVDDVDLSD